MPRTEEIILQLRETLKERFFPFLQPLNRPGWTLEQIEQNKCSRGLAALTISKLADVDPSTAVRAVIDDYDDNGIDAVYFDQPTARLILVQSKFKKGGGEPDQGETKKFADGVRDLLDQRYERFNDGFQQKLTEIEEALDLANLKIVCALAYTGGPLGRHAQREIDDLFAETNRFTERVHLELLTLERAHQLLAGEHAQASIDVDLVLENWYQVAVPQRAFYGQVSVLQLAQLFTRHGKALFERNIRYYIGSSSVNNAIAQTVRDEPEKLFYLNNGLTAISTTITPKPTARPEHGEFLIKGFSIVNGAQTVGSIASLSSTHDLTESPAKVLITIIELAGAHADFGTSITQARNFQNQVRRVDFAALDPLQEKLRRELAISGITYHYRPSQESRMLNDNSFTFEEVALALACFSGKTEFVVTAKKEIGRIWDRNGQIYKQLFTDSTSAVWVCRAVRVYRFLNSILEGNEIASSNYSERMFYRHARYFTLHIVARKSAVLRKPEMVISETDKLTLSREINELATTIFNEGEQLRGDKGYLAVSRNQTEAIPLAQRVMRRISESHPVTNDFQQSSS